MISFNPARMFFFLGKSGNLFHYQCSDCLACQHERELQCQHSLSSDRKYAEQRITTNKHVFLNACWVITACKRWWCYEVKVVCIMQNLISFWFFSLKAFHQNKRLQVWFSVGDRELSAGDLMLHFESFFSSISINCTMPFIFSQMFETFFFYCSDWGICARIQDWPNG